MSGGPAKRLAPPSGFAPPAHAALPDGTEVDLVEFARDVCRRYRDEFPDEEQRYGEAGMAWCVHDNQHLFSWAALSLRGHVDFEEKLAWLGRVLEARDFPIGRLARNLEICAEVSEARLDGAPQLARALRSGAQFVGSKQTFLGAES